MHDLTRLRGLAISDTGFVFDPMSGQSYNVNGTALQVLRGLKEGESLEAIAANLGDSFALDADHDLDRDLEEFVSRLREHGLLR